MQCLSSFGRQAHTFLMRGFYVSLTNFVLKQNTSAELSEKLSEAQTLTINLQFVADISFRYYIII